MAATVRGTAHIYGIQSGNVTNATVVDFKPKKQHQNTDSTVDELGNEIERRYDDLAQEATLTLKIRSGYSEPDVASTLTYNSIVWDVVSVEAPEVSKGFKLITLNLKKTEYIT
jgi:hypothetical protein